jgi:hypothetical protein
VGTNSNTSIVCSDYYFITWYESGRITAEYIGTTCVTEGCPATLGLRQDSLSINQGTLKINSTCGGIPEDGSPGVGGAAPEYEEITNNIKNPCLKALVTLLQNSDRLENAIGDILQNVFGKNDKIKLTFTQDDYLKSKDGKDDYGKTERVSDGVYKIALNARLLSGLSRESQTLTIMNEILHGYLTYDNDINLNISLPNQHTKILDRYIDQMASSLENLFPKLKTNHELTLALIFDNLESSVGRSKNISDILSAKQIVPINYLDALERYGFKNISSYQSIANQAKSSDSPLGTPCSN